MQYDQMCNKTWEIDNLKETSNTDRLQRYDFRWKSAMKLKFFERKIVVVTNEIRQSFSSIWKKWNTQISITNCFDNFLVFKTLKNWTTKF